MKFYSKIFISFFILIATAFSICGTWMIAASFQSSYQREIDSNKSKNEMLRASFCNIVNSMPANYFKNHKMQSKKLVLLFLPVWIKRQSFFLFIMQKKRYSTLPVSYHWILHSLIKSIKSIVLIKFARSKGIIIYARSVI